MLQHVSAISNPCDESVRIVAQFHYQSTKGKRWPWGCRRILRRSISLPRVFLHPNIWQFDLWRTCRLLKLHDSKYHFSLANTSYSKNARFLNRPSKYIWASINLSDVLRSIPRKMPLQLRCSQSRNAYVVHTQEVVLSVSPKWLVKETSQ